MPRRHADHIKGQFETPFGPMDFALTSNVHVHVTAGAMNDPSPMISVNGILYYTSISLVDRDGVWGPQYKGMGYQIHMSREGSGETGSHAAEKKAITGIVGAWTDFIGENEHLLVEAEIRHLNNQIGQIEDDVAVLKEQIRKKDEEAENLLWHEREAYKARGKMTRQGGYPTPKDWSPTGEIPEE